MFPRYRVH